MLNQIIGLGQARALARKNETVDFDRTVDGTDVWVARHLDSSGQTRSQRVLALAPSVQFRLLSVGGFRLYEDSDDAGYCLMVAGAHAARLHPDDVTHLLSHGWTRETIRTAMRRGCELPS